jgi:uncharacterized protein (TIGR02145 family)
MRKSFSKIALTATLGIAISLITACQPAHEDDDYGQSSSGIAPSSSSGKSSSSSSQAIVPVYGEPITDARDGKTYETVVIGTQTWMAKNLDFEAEGSKCYGDNLANCDTYGRLYDRATAMTVCPSGWHLPSNAEWTTLTNYVGSSKAGTKLKADSGWVSNGNGTDDYGFAALPGGHIVSDNYSLNVGIGGFWWSSTAGRYQYMAYDNADVVSGLGVGLFSVRCVQDKATGGGSSSSSGGSISHGTPVTYQGETYETVVIGTQTWMARNLNYNAEGSKCYEDDPANCDKYGRLYNWATAMALPDSCNSTSCSSQVGTKHKGICPEGWHISSGEDWSTLLKFVGGLSTSATKLKAASGWINCSPSGIRYLCEDTYGFAALPGGSGYSDGSFLFGNIAGTWWNGDGGSTRECGYDSMLYSKNAVNERGDGNKTNLLSVRCVQD